MRIEVYFFASETSLMTLLPASTVYSRGGCLSMSLKSPLSYLIGKERDCMTQCFLFRRKRLLCGRTWSDHLL